MITSGDRTIIVFYTKHFANKVFECLDNEVDTETASDCAKAVFDAIKSRLEAYFECEPGPLHADNE
jgi:hypothetical protein